MRHMYFFRNHFSKNYFSLNIIVQASCRIEYLFFSTYATLANGFVGLLAHSDKYLFFFFTLCLWLCSAQQPTAITSGFYAAALIDELWFLYCEVWFASIEFAQLLLVEMTTLVVQTYNYLAGFFTPVSAGIDFRGGFQQLIVNPLIDLDLTANTDCEDMVVFLGDILEFAEQDKTFLLDASVDFFSVLGGGHLFAALELLILQRLRRQTLSAVLAKNFNA